MTAVYQTNYERGCGNCLTACVASLLDVDIVTLPEFCIDGEWFERLHQFCLANGFSLMYWPHATGVPVLCLNVHLILLLKLEGYSELHAVVGRTVLEDRQLVTDADVEAGFALAEDIGGERWGWKTEIVHDPNAHGIPPVVGVSGYIVIGRQ